MKNLLLKTVFSTEAVIYTDVTTSRPIKTLETINNFNDNVCYFRVYASWAPQGEGQSMTKPLQRVLLSSCTNQCEGECVIERRTSTGSGLFASLGSGLVETLG